MLSVEVISEGEDAENWNAETRSEEVVGIEAEMIRDLYAQLGLGQDDGVGSVVFEAADGSSNEAKRWCEGFRVHGRGLRSVTVKAEQ